jgi:uncharacterized protein (DUF1697 family)
MDLAVQLCLLRGINVGGKSAVAMSGLRAAFESLGFTPARTYGNSGNLVFAAPDDRRPTETDLDTALSAALGLPLTVFLRSLDQMRDVVTSIPADWGDDRDRQYDIMFLRQPIDRPEIVDELRPKPEIESLIYRPGVLFWSVRVRDFSRSGISRLIGTDIYKKMTIRGPRPVRRMLDLMLATDAELRG